MPGDLSDVRWKFTEPVLRAWRAERRGKTWTAAANLSTTCAPSRTPIAPAFPGAAFPSTTHLRPRPMSYFAHRQRDGIFERLSA
ncbi:hypothetical protein ACFQX6_59595 [Streptosporangium lutulentum]